MPLPPPVVLGCGNFGGIGSAPPLFGAGESDEEAAAIMARAWEAGITWFDTADAYGGGRSERAIGRWMASTGNRPRLTTKTFNPMDEGEDYGLAPERVERQLLSSLERLGVDRVDLFLAHEFDRETPLAATVAALERLREQGLITAWGVSNFDAGQLRATLEHGRPALIQNSYSLLERGDERDVIPLCRDVGVAYQAFSPLTGGWLTGKYRRDEPVPAGSRMTLRPEPYEHLRTDRTFDALDRLGAAAQARGVEMATVALAWLLAQPGVSSVVVGPRRPEHLDPAVRALELRLTPDEAAEIAALF